MVAFKEKDVVAKNILTTLLADIMLKAKDSKHEILPDSEIIQIILKYKKSIMENKDLCKDSDKNKIWDRELELLNVYLPSQMTEQELKEAIEEARKAGIGEIGNIMKYLSSKYYGRYDNKKAYEFAKNSILDSIKI
jgi:uncharacterized protein YqeY